MAKIMKNKTLILLILSSILFISSYVIVYYFLMDMFLPIYVSCLILLFCLFNIQYLYISKHVNILSYLIFVIFALPFVHLPSYLFFDFASNPKWLYGMYVNPYMIDEKVIQLTSMFAAISCSGMILGFIISSKKQTKNNPSLLASPYPSYSNLPLISFIFFLVLGLFFTEISSTSETIFEASYGFGTTTMLSESGFDSAWLLGYILLIFAFTDAWLDRSSKYGKFKRILIYSTIIYVLIFLQFLRGERESFPMIVAFILTPFFCSRIFDDLKQYKLNLYLIFICGFALLSVNLLVALLRNSVEGLSFNEVLDVLHFYFTGDSCPYRKCYGLEDIFYGTWSAVLMTPISIAGDYIYDSYIYVYQGFRWGAEYIDLILSIPPGFVAKWFDFVRPFDSSMGPAYEMRFGGGGTHAIILPFRNFSIIGVFFIPILIAFFIGKIEVWTHSKISVTRLSLVLTMIMCAPHWLWYGEKALINSIIIWFILAWIFKLNCSLKSLLFFISK